MLFSERVSFICDVIYKTHLSPSKAHFNKSDLALTPDNAHKIEGILKVSHGVRASINNHQMTITTENPTIFYVARHLSALCKHLKLRVYIY